MTHQIRVNNETYSLLQILLKNFKVKDIQRCMKIQIKFNTGKDTTLLTLSIFQHIRHGKEVEVISQFYDFNAIV